MNRKAGVFIIVSVLMLWGYIALPQSVYGVGEEQIKCGQILKREFAENRQEHIYVLAMNSDESFEVSVNPSGDYLQTAIVLYGPSGIRIGDTDPNDQTWYVDLMTKPSIASGVLSARGLYKIRVANTAIYNDDDQLSTKASYYGGVGFYTLSIGCTNAVGNKTLPGHDLSPTATAAPMPTSTPRAALPDSPPTFNGVGFPGLAPVDMTNVARMPLPSESVTYGVTPLDNQIYGFVVDAAAGDTLDLIYTRVTGNMNLGLVLLSENNEVHFQASLVTSESLSTRLILPNAGRYTIGVFRISLVESAEPEPTLFGIRGILNPT